MRIRYRALRRPVLLLSLLLLVAGWQFATRPADVPPPLATLDVPLPPDLDRYVVDREAAIQLGKAFFWDMQVGTDGVQSCATCHFHAGADTRLKNQLAPGGKSSPDRTFGFGGPNYTLTAGDFPFPASANEVMSSQGTFHALFVDAEAGDPRDETTPLDSDAFQVGGIETRQVEPRNAPTTINAIFNLRNLWDGRANPVFNGHNPFGPRDEDACIWFDRGGTLVCEAVAIEDASLASVATGPPMDFLEMGSIGRTFPFIGRRLLPLRPLGKQVVAPDDSHLGALAAPTTGLSTTYADLIAQAFAADLHGSALTPEGFTQTEANFSLYFGLSVMLYLSTQVSDDAPIDRYAAGDASALTSRQQLGMELFFGKAQCSTCHGGPEFTNAASVLRVDRDRAALVDRLALPDGRTALMDRGFFNVAARPIEDDRGAMRDDDFGNILALAEQYRASQGGTPQFDPFAVDPCTFTAPVDPDDCAIAPGADAVVAMEGAVKTPSLRNVELTAPYLRHGGYATLMQVVEFFDRGGDLRGPNRPYLHPVLQPIGLTQREKEALVDFMLALTDERVRRHQAPFDHPQLFVPDGHEGDHTFVVEGRDGQAISTMMEIPAVGAGGYDGPRVALLNNVAARLGFSHYDGTGLAYADVSAALAYDGPTAPGGPVPLRVTLTNAGPSAATSTTVTVPLPGGFAYVDGSGTPSQGTVAYANGALTWTAGPLALADTTTLTFRVLVPDGGPWTLSALAAAPERDQDTYNNTGTLQVTTDVPSDLPEGAQIQSLAFWTDPTGTAHPIAGTYNQGVYRGTPDAAGWVDANVGLPEPLLVNDVLVASSGTVLLGTWDHGVFRSRDGGASWAPATASATIVLALTESAAGRLYAVEAGGAVLTSTDDGASWQTLSRLPGGVAPQTLLADATVPERLYAGTIGRGVYRSDDGGATWAATDEALGYVFALAADPAAPGTLWAGTAAGTYRSDDSGATWQAANTGLPGSGTGVEVRALALDPDGTALYAATWGQGLFEMADRNGSQTWTTTDLTTGLATSLALDAKSGTLLVGTHDQGLKRVTRTTPTGLAEATDVPATFALDQNYPNPFNPTTTIAFTLPQAAPVTLTVYDVAGREVAVLAEGPMPSGTHTVHFEADGLPSGLYLYRLRTPQHTESRTMVLVK